MQRITGKVVAISALVVAGAALAGCSKKDNYSSTDTSAAAMDTTSAMTASSTAPAMQDTTTTATSTTKSTTKKSTGKKTAKKSTY